MTQLVIFDIDGTLVPGASSEVRFARYLWRKGQLGWRQILAFVAFTLRYWVRYPRKILQKNKAYLSGLRVASVASLAEQFVHDELLGELYAPTLARLREHQAAGDTVTLLSGTPDFIAGALARALHVDISVGAICAQKGDRYSARPPQTHPHGPSKLVAANTIAERAGLPLAEAIAYGDSVHDAWLFRVVGQGVAVMPDSGLRAAAKGEGWEIFSEI